MSDHSPPPPQPPLRALYERERERLQYSHDPAQFAALNRLAKLQEVLLADSTPKGVLGSVLRRKTLPTVQRGLYLWGGVGRGKTWLMDLFFNSLPLKQKQRTHFHRFMQWIHEELNKHAQQAEPLQLIAQKIGRKTRVLCFDELFVSDIADAMLLGKLFGYMFERGITVVATSNVPPDGLYKEGLQRARFLPAIEQLKRHMEVLQVDGGTDYRLRALSKAQTWLVQQSPEAMNGELQTMFENIAGEPGQPDSVLLVNHRKLHPKRQNPDVVWFGFAELCEGPRSQLDYIELARCYHAVLLSGIPLLDAQRENPARRFISLVDEFYDRDVKLICSAAAPIASLYQGNSLRFEFERTKSRLVEMQSEQYLARPHKA